MALVSGRAWSPGWVRSETTHLPSPGRKRRRATWNYGDSKEGEMSPGEAGGGNVPEAQERQVRDVRTASGGGGKG